MDKLMKEIRETVLEMISN